MRKVISALLAILVIIGLSKFIGLYSEYLWYKDVGYTQMLFTPIITKAVLALMYGVFIFVFLFSAFLLLKRSVLVFANEKGYDVEQMEKVRQIISSKGINITLALISVLISILISLSFAAGMWADTLKFLNSTSFNLKDPVFSHDVSYYIFILPFLLSLLGSLKAPLILIFIASIGFYAMTGFLKFHDWRVWRKGAIEIQHSALRHLGVLLSFIFILNAISDYFKIPGTLFSKFGYVFGAGYTDLHISVPLFKVMIVVNLVSALIILGSVLLRRTRMLFLPFALVIVVSILGNISAGFYQYFIVANNEYNREAPYIKHEMDFTKIAFGLDKIKTIEFTGDANISAANIKNNQDTINNIRLNDPKPLIQTISQKQGIRQYYRFNDIDTDRYKIDGKYRQIMLSARELSGNDIDDKAKTFINLKLKYTHGFGATAVFANDVDSNGFPNLLLKDIPPVSSSKDLKITEPRIYFGELKDTGYIIVNTKTKEFDYPLGDNNAEINYKGTGGIPLTPFNKLMLSLSQQTVRFYLTNEITSNSKILMTRNIVDRVQKIAPFLRYDSDPYLVINDDGKLYWIIDAYTVSENKFPYANPSDEDINYIRNSVKVVVDAYNGKVNYYMVDKNEPIVATYNKIFPGLFKHISEMPKGLQAHIRYPEDLFRIQTTVMNTFHINNEQVFYNKEDMWDIAKKDENNYLDPYYSIMKLNGQKDEEFVLMRPFTPASRGDNKRNNIVAWMAARNDAPNYGELVLYKLPKGVEVDGPLNILSRINQEPAISSQLTLWDQKGSSVYHGNMFAIPIDNTFIYVQPIYIKAESSPLPQMQRVIVSYKDKLVMEPTLKGAINKIFGPVFEQTDTTQTGNAITPNPNVGNDNKTTLNSTFADIQRIKQEINALEEKLKKIDEQQKAVK